ncbi:hypothetical protein JHK86_039574 [Glycine max]|nr:hypothetical protein JHK86_039574 [Glycine max]
MGQKRCNQSDAARKRQEHSENAMQPVVLLVSIDDGVDHSVPQGVAADTEKSTDDVDRSVPLGDEVLAEKYAKDVHPNVQEVKGVTSKNAADEVEPLYDMPLDYAGLNEENVVAENISKFFDDFEDDNEEDEGYDDESEDYSDDDVNSDLDFVRNLSGVHADDSSGTSHYSYDSESLRSIPSSDEEDSGKKRLESPQYNSDNGFGQVHFELGMEFDTIAIFKDAVKDYTINLGREVTTVGACNNGGVPPKPKKRKPSPEKEMVCFQNAPVTEEAAIEVAPPAAAIEVSNVPTFVPLAPAVRPPPIQHANTSMVRVPFPSGVYFQECHSQA